MNFLTSTPPTGSPGGLRARTWRRLVEVETADDPGDVFRGTAPVPPARA